MLYCLTDSKSTYSLLSPCATTDWMCICSCFVATSPQVFWRYHHVAYIFLINMDYSRINTNIHTVIDGWLNSNSQWTLDVDTLHPHKQVVNVTSMNNFSWAGMAKLGVVHILAHNTHQAIASMTLNSRNCNLRALGGQSSLPLFYGVGTRMQPCNSTLDATLQLHSVAYAGEGPYSLVLALWIKQTVLCSLYGSSSSVAILIHLHQSLFWPFLHCFAFQSFWNDRQKLLSSNVSV